MSIDLQASLLSQKDHSMFFVGVDLHKYTITMVAVDASRKVHSRKRFVNSETDDMVNYLKSLGSCRLVVEATASYEWFIAVVESHVERVVLRSHGGYWGCATRYLRLASLTKSSGRSRRKTARHRRPRPRSAYDQINHEPNTAGLLSR